MFLTPLHLIKNDFITFVKDDGTIQTADKKAVLQVQGYGTVFIKHDIMIKGKLCTVTSKLQFTMLLKYLIDCFQLEVYCRKDIA